MNEEDLGERDTHQTPVIPDESCNIAQIDSEHQTPVIPDRCRVVHIDSERQTPVIPDRCRVVHIDSERQTPVIPDRCRVVHIDSEHQTPVIPDRCRVVHIDSEHQTPVIPDRCRVVHIDSERQTHMLPDNCNQTPELIDGCNIIHIDDEHQTPVIPDNCDVVHIDSENQTHVLPDNCNESCNSAQIESDHETPVIPDGCNVVQIESEHQSPVDGYNVIQIQCDIEGLVSIITPETTDEEKYSSVEHVPCDEIAAETVVMTTSTQFDHVISNEDLSDNSFINTNLLQEMESSGPLYNMADPDSLKETRDILTGSESFVALMPEETEDKEVSSQDQTLKEVNRRERDKQKKRELRQTNPVFREKERNKAKFRMKSKRQDPEYREKERQRDRERRKIARQTNEEARERERLRDREQKRYQRERLKQGTKLGHEYSLGTNAKDGDAITVINCFPHYLESEVQNYWHNRHLNQAVNIHDGSIIQSDCSTDDEDKCDSLLQLDFVNRLKADPDTG